MTNHTISIVRPACQRIISSSNSWSLGPGHPARLRRLGPLLGELVRDLVVLAADVLERDLLEPLLERLGLAAQRLQRLRLHLVLTEHLPDEQLRVAPDEQLRDPALERLVQPAQQRAVLGLVVRPVADVLRTRDDGVAVLDEDDTDAGRARVPERRAVDVEDGLAAVGVVGVAAAAPRP